MKIIVATALALAALTATGCKAKKKYSPSCQRSTTLTAPWDGYGLPTSGGRVCASDQARAEMQYLSGDRTSWEKSYETALLAAGFTKDRCSSQSCTFKRAPGDGHPNEEKATVQVIEAKKWVTVVVRR